IFGTIAFTVYGQIMLKWRIDKYGDLPADLFDKLQFVLRLLLDPLILSGFLSAFVASLFWMAAMTKFDISFAYPFMSFAFVLVFMLLVLCCFFFYFFISRLFSVFLCLFFFSHFFSLFFFLLFLDLL